MMNLTECGMKMFPVRVIRGDYDMGDNLVRPMAGGRLLNNGWGRPGTMIIGEEKDADRVPVGIELLWYSVVEDCFYECNELFNKNILDSAISEGFVSPLNNTKTEFDTLIAGMGPGGRVGIWLSGEGVTRRLYQFDGVKKEIDWKKLNDPLNNDRKVYRQKVMKEKLSPEEYRLVNKITDFGQYIKKIDGLTEFELQVLTPANFVSMWVISHNGERRYYNISSLGPSPMPVPSKLEINWTHFDGSHYQSHMQIEPEEWLKVMEHYSTFGAAMATTELKSESDMSRLCISGGKEFTFLEGVKSKRYVVR